MDSALPYWPSTSVNCETISTTESILMVETCLGPVNLPAGSKVATASRQSLFPKKTLDLSTAALTILGKKFVTVQHEYTFAIMDDGMAHCLCYQRFEGFDVLILGLALTKFSDLRGKGFLSHRQSELLRLAWCVVKMEKWRSSLTLVHPALRGYHTYLQLLVDSSIQNGLKLVVRKGQKTDSGTMTEFFVLGDQIHTFVCAKITHGGSAHTYEFRDFDELKAFGVDYGSTLVPSQ